MTNDDDAVAKEKSPRDEFVKRIAEGDTATLVAATATMLATEVLPALDEIKRNWNVVSNRLWLTEIALAEIVMLYEHLQELMPPRMSIRIAERKAFFQGRLERLTKDFSLEKYLADKKAQNVK